MVKHLHLKTTNVVSRDQMMLRGEQNSKLYGAVTKEERRDRLGEYFAVNWEDEQVAMGEVKIVFTYLQSSTASKQHVMSETFPASTTSGKAEFDIIGEAHREGGRILAWKAELFRGGKKLSMEHSYLWQ
ncbi:hypothetical protein [Persicirhabdus sediminis]|uniref:Uncharacterized protein n=1 Tax=Persicirhabdus sediminis TaxID=454144 RepID=A0A8J7MGS7_9BACT|nr:hypothetical protein [Persicirhabdus sediminis]MBK1792571.1 hypothetical protein [Persicirhabdus sediminis]